MLSLTTVTWDQELIKLTVKHSWLPVIVVAATLFWWIICCGGVKRSSRRHEKPSISASARHTGPSPGFWGYHLWFKHHQNRNRPSAVQHTNSTQNSLLHETEDPPSDEDMRHPRPPRHIRKRQAALAAAARVIPAVKAKQLFDVFLVLDIEGTCNRGSDFDFPNEIIEFPVCLMAWQDKDVDMRASQLEVVDEFRSFVRPTWRPTLSDFCVELTGISQEQVDSAPTFPEVVEQFESFLTSNGLIDENGERLVRFCWCTDGPFDIRDFIVKQCFISMIPIPHWLKGNVCDVRTLVLQSINRDIKAGKRLSKSTNRRLLNISTQLEELGLPMFEGRQHSGIDDTRNITRILAELGRRGVPILPNTTVEQNKRWPWMGKRGQVLEEYVK